MQRRLFENDKVRSLVMDVGSLDVNRTSHSTHEKAISDDSWKDYLNSIDGVYSDPTFPPKKSTILGMGVDLNGKPVDPTA